MKIRHLKHVSGAGLALLVFASALVNADNAYKVNTGPFEIAVVNDVSLDFAAMDKQLPLRIAYPVAKGPRPVIVFSHGGGSSKDMYSRLSDHWASHGYVVIQPSHSDSRSLGFSFAGMESSVMLQLVLDRRKDMRHILDSLDVIEARVPQLEGQLDRERLIASGHSMGAATAMAVTGLVLENKVTGIADRFDEDRFDALLLIGDPGNRTFMPDDPWRAIAIPTLIVTGTNDYGAIVDASGMKMEFADGTVMAETPNHYLFIDGLDHYYGGLICRTDVGGEPDDDGLVIAKGVSTAFLDAYTKDDREAVRFLEGRELPGLTAGRATLENR